MEREEEEAGLGPQANPELPVWYEEPDSQLGLLSQKAPSAQAGIRRPVHASCILLSAWVAVSASPDETRGEANTVERNRRFISASLPQKQAPRARARDSMLEENSLPILHRRGELLTRCNRKGDEVQAIPLQCPHLDSPVTLKGTGHH